MLYRFIERIHNTPIEHRSACLAEWSLCVENRRNKHYPTRRPHTERVVTARKFGKT